ncbi:hypothetical protein [Arthrobacter globiformis]|uniref:hypothetical protein n=1 Tax=Arthrobacter globiformis TaxID=1665 RepID=UPI00278B0D4F|nr:hypothetical protein [Arthrobacter globiformis]MDQ0865725.1 hypothetical protein [Arthrobacter globiformis]
MSAGKVFTTQPRFYRKNYEMGATLRVVPAAIGTDTGGTTPGVAIFTGPSFLIAAITAEHAWALADQLADVLDALQQEAA